MLCAPGIRYRFGMRRVLLWVSILGFLVGCRHQPEWRRRADALLADSRFPRPGNDAARCLTDALLAEGLRAAVGSVGFAEVADFGPLYGAGCSAQPSPACASLRGRTGQAHFPQIDLSVIAFNRPGCPQPVVKATVVFDRQHPTGFVAVHDPQSLAITNIRFRRWDEARWNGGRWRLQGDGERAQAEIVAGTEKSWEAPYSVEDELGTMPLSSDGIAHIDFMSPWPASVFKLMVATYLLRLLDHGQTGDGQPLSRSTPIALPGADLVTSCPPQPQTLSLQQALETMLQWSSNCATAGLVRYLHAHGEIVQSPEVDARGFPRAAATKNGLNDLLAGLGLPTLQMNRTIALSGRWGNGDDNYDRATASVANTHMTSWDTARLLWLVDDLPPALQPRWEVAPGQSLPRSPISDAGKALFRDLLRDVYPAFGLVSNRSCPGPSLPADAGPPPAPGIPARLSAKWLDGHRLHSPGGDHPYPRVVDAAHPQTDSSPFAGDLSRCQAQAEVEYLSKAGLTNVAGSSVGIVRGLRDRRPGFARHYIVSFFSTLGTRYTDAERLPTLAQPRDPLSPPPIATTQTVPQLGATLDAWLALWLETP